jgi:hypothetical protein
MLQNSNQEQSATTSRWTPWQEGVAELFIALIFPHHGHCLLARVSYTQATVIHQHCTQPIDIMRHKESHAKFAKIFELDFAFFAPLREPKL